MARKTKTAAKRPARKAAKVVARKARAPAQEKAAREPRAGSNQTRVLDAFGKSKGGRTIDEVCADTGLSTRQVRASIDRLRASGVPFTVTERGKFSAAAR